MTIKKLSDQVNFDQFIPHTDDPNIVTVFTVSQEEAEDLGAFPCDPSDLESILIKQED